MSATTRALEQKLSRLRGGASLRVLDLFSGCGGISLGFHAAGYEIAAAIEVDSDAAKSHGMNFHPDNPKYAVARDITRTTPLQLTHELGLGAPSHAFDIVAGGPPCQAFARVGRSKLREIADHPEAFRHDARARLYLNYLQYVEACAPLAVLMENVPDMLNHGGHNIAEEVCEVLESRNYRCAYTLLNAAHYGVPQTRERMFLLAYHQSLGLEPTFPVPTHWIALPSGYGGSRAVALKLLAKNADGQRAAHYVPPPEPTPDLPAAITAEDAIKDLPRINARSLLEQGILRRGARRFDKPITYNESGTLQEYAKLMRRWEGFTGRETLMDHGRENDDAFLALADIATELEPRMESSHVRRVGTLETTVTLPINRARRGSTTHSIPTSTKRSLSSAGFASWPAITSRSGCRTVRNSHCQSGCSTNTLVKTFAKASVRASLSRL